MAVTNYIQSSFTSGELTPRLAGRTDLSKYKSGLASLYNFLVSPYGCIFRRPGTRYVVPAKNNTANGSRLVRFEYSNEQAYQLEFYAGGIRFYKDQGQILQSRGFTNGDFTTNIDGWTARNAGSGAIAHDTNRLQLTGGGVGNEARAYQSIANLGTSQYTVTLDVITASVTYRVGTAIGGSSLGTGTLTTGTGKTFTFTPATNGTIYIEFESTTTSRIDNVVLDSPIYQIDSSYLISEIYDLRFAQSFDTLYITHQDHPPRQLQRLAHDSWVLSDMVFDEPPYLDINNTSTTLEPSDITGTVTITASSDVFSATDVGRAIRFKAGPDRTNVTTYTGTGAQTYFDVPFFPRGVGDLEVNFIESTGARTAKAYEASLTPAAGNYTILTSGQVKTGDTATTSQRVEISPINAGSGEWGWAIITAFTDATEVEVEIQRDFDFAAASTDWRLGAWSETTGYPKCVVFHEQRLYFASTPNQPQTFWGSAIGNYTNFQPDNILYKGAVDNDTSVSFTLAANNSQAINWLSSKGALIIGTSNSVFSASATSGSISASNIRVKKEADIPCDFQPVAETHNEVIFVEALGQRVYSVHYSFQIDGYEVSELSLLSEHLGKKSPILEIVYQPTAKMIWARRADGSLLSCTYIRDQEVSGWARHEIGGNETIVDSLSVIPGDEYSELWLTVSRDIDSVTTRYVEFMSKEFEFADKEDAVFLDCSLTYDGVPADNISGLDHLEGETIQVVADGSVHPDVTVSGGAVTLNKEYSVVTFGYHKKSELETMSIEAGSKIGSSQGSISRITEVSIRFYDTIGGEVGYDDNETDIVAFRNASDVMDSSPSLYSGFKILKFPAGFNRTYKVYLKQDQPLPMTILNIVFKAQVSDAQ